MRQKAETWTYLELSGEQVPTKADHAAIAPNEAYLTLTLRSLRIVDVRKALKRFYGAVHSWSSVAHVGTGRAEFEVVTTPADLRDADAEHLDRVIAMDRPLLGPVPYRGGGLDLELGLFSVMSQDLAGPFLDVLEGMSKAAGVTFVSAARPFIAPLTQGISLLTGSTRNTTLEIGIAKNWEPTTGYYAIIRAPRGLIPPQDVRVADDQHLVDSGGNVLGTYPYVVFSIDASRDRPNWFEIPELKDAYAELNAEVSRGKVQDAEQAFAVFRRKTLTSPDLLFADARVITDKVDAQVKEVLRATQTAGREGRPLPPLAELSPFSYRRERAT
jgi:hypothetical protein